MKLSTGLRNFLLSGGSIRDALNGGVIRIYSGAPPVTADFAVPGGALPLVEISAEGSGDGLNFEAAAVGGRLQKNPSEVWSGVAGATQQATWFRFVRSVDDGAESGTALRMQGTVAPFGGDLNMSSDLFTDGATETIDYFSVFQPE
jgi:hypothetical protein